MSIDERRFKATFEALMAEGTIGVLRDRFSCRPERAAGNTPAGTTAVRGYRTLFKAAQRLLTDSSHFSHHSAS